MRTPLTLLQSLFTRPPPPAPQAEIVRESLVLVAAGAGPLGLQWESLVHRQLGPMLVPATWCRKPAGADYCYHDEESGCVILIMQEHGVSSAGREHYADRYARSGSARSRGPIHGRLGSTPVARTEGWRQGRQNHYLRDYFLFMEDAVVMVRGYAPAHEAYLMGLVIDAMVASATTGSACRPAEACTAAAAI